MSSQRFQEGVCELREVLQLGRSSCWRRPWFVWITNMGWRQCSICLPPNPWSSCGKNAHWKKKVIWFIEWWSLFLGSCTLLEKMLKQAGADRVNIWRQDKYKQYNSERKPLELEHAFPSPMTQRKEDENYFHFSTIYFCHVTVRCTALQKRDLFTFDQQRPQTQ